MAEFTGQQVIQYLDNNKVRVFEVKSWDSEPDQVETVELTGKYEDIDIYKGGEK